MCFYNSVFRVLCTDLLLETKGASSYTHAGMFGKLYLLGEKKGTLRGVVPVPERTARPGIGQASQMSREAELGFARILGMDMRPYGLCGEHLSGNSITAPTKGI